MQHAIALGDAAEVAAILTRTKGLSTHRFKDAKKDLQSPLNFACLTGNLTIVQLLLENGADSDLTFQDAKRRFPLHCAVESHSLPLVEAMLGGGMLSASYLRIMLREKTALGQTVFHVAAATGSAEVLSLLLATLPTDNPELRAAQLDAVQDSCGMTPLMIAATAGSLACTTLLLDSDADIHKQRTAGTGGDGGQGCTALVLACIEGHIDVVRLLLARGADPNVEDAGGDTALSWALLMEHAAVAELLGHVVEEGKGEDEDDASGGRPPAVPQLDGGAGGGAAGAGEEGPALAPALPSGGLSRR
jgi:ankyrin repeat protein